MKFVFVTFAVFIISFVASAQLISDYGLKISLNSSSITATDTKSNFYFNPNDYYDGNSINPSVGFFLNSSLNEYLFVEFELSYIPKGSRKTVELPITSPENPYGDGTKTDFTTSIDLRYLELGFNIKPTIKLGKVPAYLIAGASANYTLNAVNIAYINLEEFLFSYKLGVGCNLKEIANAPIFIEAKYIGDFSYFYNYEYGKLWNKVIQVTLGVNL
jgi:hypothetical protein